MGTTNYGPIPAPNDDELRSNGAAAMRSIASAVDANYLKKGGDTATAALSYPAANTPDFNVNENIPTVGQLKYHVAAECVPKNGRPFITRSNQPGGGWNGQPGAGAGADLRYIIYNHGTGELLWSVTAFPQTVLAKTTDPEVTAKTRADRPMPTVREVDAGGKTLLGVAMEEVPDAAIQRDEDGNPVSFDIIQLAMLAFAELADLRKRVADLENP